jgi:hypothetical protein
MDSVTSGLLGRWLARYGDSKARRRQTIMVVTTNNTGCMAHDANGRATLKGEYFVLGTFPGAAAAALRAPAAVAVCAATTAKP